MNNLAEDEKELVKNYRNTITELRAMTFDVARQNAAASRVIRRHQNSNHGRT